MALASKTAGPCFFLIAAGFGACLDRLIDPGGGNIDWIEHRANLSAGAQAPGRVPERLVHLLH